MVSSDFKHELMLAHHSCSNCSDGTARHGTPRQVYSRAETLGTLFGRAGRVAHHFYDRSYCATCSSTTCRGDESACEHYYLLAFLSHLYMTERSDTDTIHVSKMISASFQIPSGYTQRTYVNKCTARPPISAEFLYLRLFFCRMHRGFVQ